MSNDLFPRGKQRGQETVGVNLYPKGKRLGTVGKYDSQSHSYSVIIEGEPGNPLEPRRRELPNIPFGKSSIGTDFVLTGGTSVVVDFGLGNQPYISKILNIHSNKATDTGVGSQIDLGGGYFNTDTDKPAGAYFRDPNTPKNMLPGDQVISTPDGNYVGVLRGKVTRVYGSQRAQILVSGMHDAVRVICENYEHFSSIGELKIQTVNGRASLSFRGRVDQKTERDDGSGCVHFDIGDEGQLVSLQIKSPLGQTFSKAQFTPGGSIQLLSFTEDLDTVCARIRRDTAGVQRIVRVDGNDVHTIGGGRTENIKGGWKVTVGSSSTLTCGQDLGQIINNNYLMGVGGNVTFNVTGGPALMADPLNVAMSEKFLYGSKVSYFGFKNHNFDPSGKSAAGMRAYVYNGAIIFGEEVPIDIKSIPNTSMMACIALNTTKPGSIGLGGVPPAAAVFSGGKVTAKDPAVKQIELAALLTKLIQQLDNHSHPTAWGPSGTPIPGQPAPATLFNPMLGDLPGIGSTIVMIGS